MTISTINPAYVADVERADGCGRYNGYVNASFHRVDGRWRLVLDGGQLYAPNRAGTLSGLGSPAVGAAHQLSMRCLSLAVVLYDPSFVGPDRAVCRHGRPRWLP